MSLHPALSPEMTMDPKAQSAWLAMTPEQQAQMQTPQMQGLQQAFQPAAAPPTPADLSLWEKIMASFSHDLGKDASKQIEGVRKSQNRAPRP